MIAASVMSGCSYRAASTSAAYMFSPPRMMTSFNAVDDVEVAVRVETAEVAGVEPAVGERLGRLALAAEVAAHDRRSLQPDLADRRRPAHRCRRGSTMRIVDDRRDRLADALRIRDVRGAEVGDRRARRLGQAVAVAGRGARRRLLVDAAHELGRDERRARRDARRAIRASRPSPAAASSSSNIVVGTPAIVVMPSRSMISTASPASHLYMSTIFPPAAV